MGRIYLNTKDTDVLANLYNITTDKDVKDVLDRILKQEEKNRKHFNEIANIYKKQKRQENRFYARSKKEIEKMR